MIIILLTLLTGQVIGEGLQGRIVLSADSDGVHDELVVFKSDILSGYAHSRFNDDLQTAFGLNTPILSYGYLQPSGGMELLNCEKIPGNDHFLEKTHFCGLSPQRIQMQYQALALHTPGRGLGLLLLDEEKKWSFASWQKIDLGSWEAGFCQGIRPFGSLNIDDDWYSENPYCPSGMRINFSPYLRFRTMRFQNQIAGIFSMGENTAPGFQIIEHWAMTIAPLRIQGDYLYTSDEYWTFSAEKPLYRHQIRGQIWFNLAPAVFIKISDNFYADSMFRNDIHYPRRDDIRLSLSGYIQSFDWGFKTRYLSETREFQDFNPRAQKYSGEIGYDFPSTRLALKMIIYTDESPKNIFVFKGAADLPGRFLFSAHIGAENKEDNWSLGFSSRLYWRHPALTLVVWFETDPILLGEDIEWQEEWDQSVFGLTLSLPIRIDTGQRDVNF